MAELSSPVRILIVDDEPSVRLLLRRWIESSLDAEISEAQDGLQALEKVAEGGVEILVSDINMPVLNGIDMLSLLQADPARHSMEMLIVSQVTSEEKVQQAIALGVSDYLLKPLQRDWVIRRLQAAAERVGARRRSASDPSNRPKTAVLVADADPNYCAFAEASLSGPYHVETARSMAETLVKTLRGRPDVVLLSTALPGPSVEFALDRIRGVAQSDPPRVYLLGEDAPPAEPPDGAAGLLSRSFVPETLRKELAGALSGGRAPSRGVASWDEFLGAELLAATSQAFGMMAGEEPEERDAAGDPPPGELQGWIDLASDQGEFQMRLELTCAESLAAALTRAMLGEELPPGEAPPLDALQEVLNVIAGRIKNACVERRLPTSIGSPQVGREPAPDFGEAQLVIAKRFEWMQEPLELTLRGRPLETREEAGEAAPVGEAEYGGR